MGRIGCYGIYRGGGGRGEREEEVKSERVSNRREEKGTVRRILWSKEGRAKAR